MSSLKTIVFIIALTDPGRCYLNNPTYSVRTCCHSYLCDLQCLHFTELHVCWRTLSLCSLLQTLEPQQNRPKGKMGIRVATPGRMLALNPAQIHSVPSGSETRRSVAPGDGGPGGSWTRFRSPVEQPAPRTLQPYKEDKDGGQYSTTSERVASSCQLPQERWTLHLNTLLSERHKLFIQLWTLMELQPFIETIWNKHRLSEGFSTQRRRTRPPTSCRPPYKTWRMDGPVRKKRN